MKARYLTPAVTIFDQNGRLDKDGNTRLYDHLIKGGVDGIVVMGSTGEFFNMTMDAVKELIDISTGHCNGKISLYIGTSRMSPQETIELGNYALNKGADGVMVISPYYFKLTADCIENYYDIVADGINGPVYLYNFPDITGHDLTPEITLNLLRKHKNIVGYKDTISLIAHTRDLMNLILPEFPNFEIFSGYDENFAAVALGGGAGVIGGLSNLMPEVFAQWVKAIENKDYDSISLCQKKVNVGMKIYAVGSPYIAIMKRALNLRGLGISEYMTDPFLNATAIQVEKLKQIMKELQLEEI